MQAQKKPKFNDDVWEISKNGFLPSQKPIELECMSPYKQLFERMKKNGINEEEIKELPDITELIKNMKAIELESALQVLCYILHFYVVKSGKSVVPDKISKPFLEICSLLKRPTIITYASCVLFNWKKCKDKKTILEGKDLMLSFTDNHNEDTFFLVHLEIERRAIPIVNAIQELVKIMDSKKGSEQFPKHLDTIIKSIEEISSFMKNMFECDTNFFFNELRPFVSSLKDIVLGEGGKAVSLGGASGAQSSIFPSLDAFLGITKENELFKKQINTFQQYMPWQHQRWLESLEKRVGMFSWIKENNQIFSELKDQVYQKSIELIKTISKFRKFHLGLTHHFISKNISVGTGGSPFKAFLEEHIKTTNKFISYFEN